MRKSDSLQLDLLSDIVVATPLALKIKDVYNIHLHDYLTKFELYAEMVMYLAMPLAETAG